MNSYVLTLIKTLLFFHINFCLPPQSFIIDVQKCCGINPAFKANATFLHVAVFANCFSYVVKFLLKECKDLNVNITNDDL